MKQGRKETLIKDGPVTVSSLRVTGQGSAAQLPIGAVLAGRQGGWLLSRYCLCIQFSEILTMIHLDMDSLVFHRGF